jgi:hypothetical protein
MVTIDCPFCDGALDGAALLRDAELSCDECAVVLELAPDEASIAVAAAA